MLISNAAIFDLEYRCAALRPRRGWFLAYLAARLRLFRTHRPTPAGPPQLSLVWDVTAPPTLHLVDHDHAEPEETLSSAPQDQNTGDERDPRASFRWRRHPQLRSDRASGTMPESERAARLAAVRGVFAARDGDFESATDFFHAAVREPEIDLGEVPGFWKLSRAGMMVAIDAYEAAGRHRDASAMTARIRTIFRPRLVREPRQIAARAAGRKLSSGG